MRVIFNSTYIAQLSDTKLINKYNFIKDKIERTREITGFARVEDINYKYELSREIRSRGLSYE